MKVFIYSKRTSEKLEQFEDVSKVSVSERKHELTLITNDGDVFRFDTKLVKTTVYQN